MRTYTVHAPPGEPAPEDYAFVKDGFSWPALFVPVLWILWHRLWLTLVWYVVYVLVLAWIGRLFGDTNAVLVALVGGILLALEANNIRRLSLARRGWSEIGGSFGANLDEAEIRFYQRARQPAGAQSTGRRDTPAPVPYAPSRAVGDEEPIFGLFPEPER